MSQETATDAARSPEQLEQALRLSERKLQVVQDVAAALGSTLDLDVLLATIMAKATTILDADRSTLYLLDEKRDELWSKVTQGGRVQEIRLKIPEGIAGWVAKTGETLNIPDAYDDDRFNPEVDKKSGYRTRTMLTVAMKNNQGRVVGVVQVLNKRDGTPFNRDDEDLLRALVSQAAVSIENSKLYRSLVGQNAKLLETQEKLEQRMYELDLLYQLEQETLRADSVDEVLERLSNKAMDLVGAHGASILMSNPGDKEATFHAAVGPKGPLVRTLQVPVGVGFAGWVLENGEPLVVNDVASDPRHNRKLADKVGYFPKAVLCVPIKGEGRVLGALELLDKTVGDGQFDDNDLKAMSLIAGHAAKIIQLAQAREERVRENSLAAIGQMLSGVLHDFKTPMTIAVGYAQILESVADEETRSRYVQQILKQLELMDLMTREVLAFARGDSSLLIRKVYLHRFWAEIREHLRKEFEGKNIELEVDTPYRGLAYFDEIKFRRVVHNLATNAARAMPDGGKFTIASEADDESLRLSFTDTGRGIPREMEGRLFDAFATHGSKEGTGLGLAIVQKIVHDHHGEITYETERGKGTTFRIVLPLERTDVSSGERRSPTVANATHDRKEPAPTA